MLNPNHNHNLNPNPSPSPSTNPNRNPSANQAEQREDARLRRPVEPRELAAEALDHGGAQAGVGRVRAADRHRLRERRERVLAHAARGGGRARARGGEELGGEGVEAEGGHWLGLGLGFANPNPKSHQDG